MITASHPLLAELSLDSLSLCVCADVWGRLLFFVYVLHLHTQVMHRVRRYSCCDRTP
jgi:hypothetical protein